MEVAMMYVDEDEVWKCPKHPTKRHRSGICSKCLRERLDSLCPDCATLRPCGCPCATSASTSSSSSSSSFARFFTGSGSVRRDSYPTEPSMRRSRSVAVSSLFRSRSRFVRDIIGETPETNKGSKTAAFLGIFKRDKSKRYSGVETMSCGEDEDGKRVAAEAERARMMRKSKSVAVTSSYAGGDVRSEGRAASRGWHFPSPMKAFRGQSKVPKAAAAPHERSPLYRG